MDKQVPENAVELKRLPTGQTWRDDFIFIKFTTDDPENPFNWPRRKKKIITAVATGMTFFVMFITGGYSSAQPGLKATFNTTDTVVVLGITLFVLGFAIMPLLLAPLSEIYGRSPIYLSCSFLCWILLLPQALAQNITTVLVSRFFTGCFGSVGATMVGGTIADIWEADERGTYMAVFAGCAFISTFAAPLIYGITAERLGFRWTFWLGFILCGTHLLLLIFILQETRGPVLLSRRAKKMRKETGDDRYVAAVDLERASIATMVRVSLTRPIRYLFTEPIVLSFSVWVTLSWGVFYLVLEALSLVLETSHGFTNAQRGYAFVGPMLASCLGVACSPLQERLYKRARERNNNVPVPEARLYFALGGTILFTVGLFLLAFTSGPSSHWLGPIFGASLTIFGCYHIYHATFTYLADAYQTHASSAIAGQSFMRNMLGAWFPLFTRKLFDGLGYRLAGSVVGICAAAISVLPFLLLIYGRRIRARSKLSIHD